MSHIHMYMYVYVAGCICPTCYPWASVSFWFSWPRFGYKCALIAIPVAGRAEQSRVGRGRHLAQWVRWFVSWDTIAQVPVVGLETCATTRRMAGRRRKGTLFDCCYFVCRLLCVLVRLCGCLLLLYTLDMLYLSISISLSLSSHFSFTLPVCLLVCLPKSIQRRNSRWRQLKVQSWMCPSILKDIVSTHTSTVQQGFSYVEQKLKVKWD